MRRMIPLSLVLAACSAPPAATVKSTPTAWAFQGATVDSVTAQLKPGSRLVFRLIDGKGYLQVDANAPMDEAHPCPPFDDC